MQDEYWTEAYKVGLAMMQAVMDRIEGLTGEALLEGLLENSKTLFSKLTLSSWTGAVQLAAFTTGKRLIRENAERLSKGGLSKSEETLIKKQLHELGIDENKQSNSATSLSILKLDCLIKAELKEHQVLR